LTAKTHWFFAEREKYARLQEKKLPAIKNIQKKGKYNKNQISKKGMKK
jgi:hypothetical protein